MSDEELIAYVESLKKAKQQTEPKPKSKQVKQHINRQSLRQSVSQNLSQNKCKYIVKKLTEQNMSLNIPKYLSQLLKWEERRWEYHQTQTEVLRAFPLFLKNDLRKCPQPYTIIQLTIHVDLRHALGANS